jgi:membrane protease YdiL (CAAX protease family)
MLGILVQLLISWLLVWLIQKKDLGVLGFKPTRRRLLYFAVFFFVTAICCASGFLMRMWFGRERWSLNPNFTGELLLDGIWWNIKSVLFEELIFRGVILYILIKRTGVLKAILISSAAFGIYHWFSYEIVGNVLQMVIVFIITGLMGTVLAYGYAKTFSLYIPCAIHLGWNFTQMFVFTSGTIGDGILIQVKPVPVVNVSYFIYYVITFVPLLSALVFNSLLIRKVPQAGMQFNKCP